MVNLRKLIKKSTILAVFFIVSCGSSTVVENVDDNNSTKPTKLVKPVKLAVSKVDTAPNMKTASPSSRKLLESFTKTMFTPNFYSGQNIGSSNYLLEQNYEASIVELRKETDKTPAIFTVDYAWEIALDDYSKTNAILKSHLQKEGMVIVSMHPGNPFLEGGLYTKGTGDYKFDDLFKPGTKPYIFWQKILKQVADGLYDLQSDDHTIMWRPLHEMNGNWFWWGGGDADQITAAEFKKLWLSIYDYFKTRKLDNLLWMYSPNSNHDQHSTIDVLSLYPGDNFVDIVALDYYDDSLDRLNINGSVDKLLSLNKPFGFAELGQTSRTKLNNMDIVDVLKNKFPHTAFVVHWHTNTDKMWPVPRSIIDNHYPEAYLNNERVLTRQK